MLSFDHMLTKRTNILFDQKTWDMLVGLAKSRGSSVGELVRVAVKEKFEERHDRVIAQRKAVFDEIERIRSTIKHQFTREEIKESIEDGRKY